MIDAATYAARRTGLRPALGSDLCLIPGNRLQPRNYPDNVFPFRQNSHVLYYAGVNRPDVALLMGPEPGDDRLFGPPEELDDVVWHGPHPSLEEEARGGGIGQVGNLSDLKDVLRACLRQGRRIHYLPPYQAQVAVWLGELLGLDRAALLRGVSRPLMEAVAKGRSRKSPDEVAEIEEALQITACMHRAAMAMARPGVMESELAARIQEIALASDRAQAYNPIVSVEGEVLHNNSYQNRLASGQLLLNDSAAESRLFYASDITRTCPVDPVFTTAQKEIYEVCLQAQLAGIEAVRPGISYREVHLIASLVMTRGLKALGLMRGSPEEAVAAGAHALFFPHGLGHQLGLDVHDMEDLGDVVGYGSGQERSTQFGLSFLRLARPLEPGFVFTVEPGVYFIPALIDRWREQALHTDFINYEKVNALRGLGGIRIEDNVLCTEEGHRVLGPPIPKTVQEVESAKAA